MSVATVATVASTLVLALLAPTPRLATSESTTSTQAVDRGDLVMPGVRVRSRVWLRSPTSVVTDGDRLVVRARTSPRLSRPVQLQRRSSNGWYAVQDRSTDRRGRVVFRGTASEVGVARLRVLVPRARVGGRWYAAVRSDLLEVRVLPAHRPWRTIETMSGVTCGIAHDDSGWCWGDNRNGQVGSSSTDPIHWRPASVYGSWRQLRSSGVTTCGIRTDDTGFCWGGSGRGQVGAGSTVDALGPQLLPGRWRTLGTAAEITCGVRTDDSGWCWGDNRFGGLGDGGSVDQLRPVRVPGSWRTVQTSGSHTCGIRTDDTGWCWGPVYGTDAIARTPQELPGRWASFSLYNQVVCGVQTDGSGWCWGANHRGMLGVGDTDSRVEPARLPGTWRRIDVPPHGTTTCGVRTDATGWCWGSNMGGSVGDGTTLDRSSPRQVPGAWRSIVNDNGTTCGVRTDGSGWCWGINDSGEIGDGTSGPTAFRTSPHLLPGRWSSLRTGNVGTTCGVQVDGTGWCWGNGVRGELGDGSTRHLTPHIVP